MAANVLTTRPQHLKGFEMLDRYTKSAEWRQRAEHLLPCGAQTLSKAPNRFPAHHPTYLVRGQGSRVYCVDGHEYIDYVQALGPIILGHNHPRVTEAIQRQAQDGFLFSLSHPLEVEVAELLRDMVPCAEAVRYVKTGSAAVEACVTLARVYTGRLPVAVARGSYHGACQWFQVGEALGANGVPPVLLDYLATFDYNSAQSLEALFTGEPLAALVIEPGRDFEPTVEFLQAAKRLCDQHGTVLIFDEVVTSFRVANGGAQEKFGVTPHLCALGKAMANGAPLSAIVGQRDIMFAAERTFISGTFHGECLSLAAAKACLTVIRDEPVTEHCYRQGARLRSTFDHIMGSMGIAATAKGQDVCSRQTFHTGDLTLDKDLGDLWLSETAQRGLLLGRIQYMSYAHDDKALDHTIEAMGFAADVLRQALASGNPASYLHGAPAKVDTYRPTRAHK